MTTAAYPLSWPAIRPRTERRQRAKFKTAFGAARDDLLRELRLLGAYNVLISTNIPLRKDGLPYATYATPDDPGVAVYFELRGEARCIAVDKWDRIHDNLKAIQKTVEAIRGIERWGDAELMYAAFEGFQALPETASTGIAWWDTLGVPYDATVVMIDRAFRERAQALHPDRGGDTDAFLRLKDAHERGREQALRREREAVV
jgi:hypothetical protein